MSGIPTFATPPGFLGLTRHDPDARVCIAGIPHDIATTNRPGARFGPAAIRAASRMLVDGDHPMYGSAVDLRELADVGDFAIALGDIPETLRLIEKQAAAFKHLVTLGGDHSITLPLLRALAERTGPVALIHFDAHLDTWPDSFGQRYGHGSPFYHALKEGLIDGKRSVQIGIRSPVQTEVMDWTIAQGLKVYTAYDVHMHTPHGVAEEIREIVGDAPAYLTFDVDALDPAYAPGTGTPEIGGLSSWQAQGIVRRLRGLNFVGMDVVEVSPPYDHAEITALAAATIAWEYLALLSYD
jgi:agmatinase